MVQEESPDKDQAGFIWFARENWYGGWYRSKNWATMLSMLTPYLSYVRNMFDIFGVGGPRQIVGAPRVRI